MFNINYKDRSPIYQQIKENIKKYIMEGIFTAGDKLPSVREMSSNLAVNPNTVQRAYRELEQEGYIVTVAGKGVFASGDRKADSKTTDKLLLDMEKIVSELRYFGESKEEIIKRIEEIYN